MANDNQIAFLCSRLKELREKNGCTMDDMAKKIDVLEGLKPGTGMNKSSISRVEGGKTAEKTLLEMARKYCKVFGMSESQTEQFLRGEKVAVPDTSALLKNSQLIDELNKEYSKVVIPKVVVDELDNIKNKNSGSLGRKAWEVIRGISYGSRTILMEYNGDADEDNEDCKIIYIAQEASYIEDHDIDLFKLGFVGNGEPMLDYEKLKQYIAHIGDYLKSGRIAAYTITNGLLVDREKLEFFKEYNVNVGFSVDGISAIHDKYRCGTHERVMENIALYKEVNGKYPSMNCTVGKEIIDNPEATIGFFEQFGNRITFSRMIGKQGISLPDFNAFLNKAMERLNVRTGGYDCTMYGGMCGAGMDNIFYANGKIFICGNCIDLPFSMPYDTPLNEVSFDVIDFDRSCCFKEVFTG